MFHFRAKAVLNNWGSLPQAETHTISRGMFFQAQRGSLATSLQQNLLSLTLGNIGSRRFFSKGASTMEAPIGISDFREIIEKKDPKGRHCLFVDKSLLIKDIIDDGLTKVKLFTRPRRFGKTLNMSMLHHFFSKEAHGKPTDFLFKNLKIAKHDEYMKHQGKYPVIFLTFKDIQSSSFDKAYDKCYETIRSVYLEHEKQVLAANSLLGGHYRRDFESFLEGKASDALKADALKNLIFYLSAVYGAKPIVLIDEYDTPIQDAYANGYYKEMIAFMKCFLGAGLKDNSYLEQAILTGILRVSKESLFSGINNVETYSVLDPEYGDYFGFVEAEVVELLKLSGLENQMTEVRNWYNGYQFGNSTVYNPWSIVHYIKKQGNPRSYWVNTSGNELIRDLLIDSSVDFKQQFEILLQGKSIEVMIDERVVFADLKANEHVIWSLLLMSGYLKAKVLKNEGTRTLCELSIPNNEVKDLYKTIIMDWFSSINSSFRLDQVVSDLLNGDVKKFEEKLQNFFLRVTSVHDVKGKQPEKFFHGFLIGLFACIDLNAYTIDSNKEAGLGRFDIIVAPHDAKKLGIIIEVKSISGEQEPMLKEAAEGALQQIKDKRYDCSSLLQQVKNVLKVGIVFNGKEIAMAYETGPKSLENPINASIKK